MNIMATDDSPIICAYNLCDAHVRSQAKEGVQMAVQALLIRGVAPERMPLTVGTKKPHKGGYPHHPATIWVATSLMNFVWNLRHTQAICYEYKKRFGKEHASWKQIQHILDEDLMHEARGWPERGATPFARCFNQSKGENEDLLEWPSATKAYREFYMRDKARFATWSVTAPPKWWRPTHGTA